MKFPVLDTGRFAVCYDGIELRYFDNWHRAEDYLYEVYEKQGHTGYYVKEL